MTRSNLVIPAVRKNIILNDGLTQRRSDSSLRSLPSNKLFYSRTFDIKKSGMSEQSSTDSYKYCKQNSWKQFKRMGLNYQT